MAGVGWCGGGGVCRGVVAAGVGLRLLAVRLRLRKSVRVVVLPLRGGFACGRGFRGSGWPRFWVRGAGGMVGALSVLGGSEGRGPLWVRWRLRSSLAAGVRPWGAGIRLAMAEAEGTPPKTVELR